MKIFPGGNILCGNYPGGDLPGGNLLGGSFPGWEFSRWNFSGWVLSEWEFSVCEFSCYQTYICRYRINQHLITLKLDSVSINKSIAPEFATVKFSQDLDLM